MTRNVTYCFLACLAVGLAGCSRLPYRSDFPLSSQVKLARDAVLRYRIPMGWFDASNERTLASGKLVWIVRSDYAASIALSEVRLDHEARRDVRRNGLVRLAHLMAGLAVGDGSSVLVRSPETFSLHGKELCAFEVASLTSGDSTRVVLVELKQRVYEITALVAGQKQRATTMEVYSVQQSFLDRLQW